MASRRFPTGALLLTAGLLAAALGACRAETRPEALNLGRTEPGELAGNLELRRSEVAPEELGYRWNYPSFPRNYDVDPLNRPYLSGRSVAELGSYAGPWLEGREAQDLPVGVPNVVVGQGIARALGARITPQLRPTLDESPYQAFVKLREGLRGALVDGRPLTRDALWSLTFYLYRQLEPDLARQVPTRLDPRKLQNGAQIFGANCAMCHGADGSGLGHSGRSLQPPPANFHEPRRMYNRSEARLYTVLREGIYGSGMPPWGDKLSQQEIRSVVAFIRSFAYSSEPPAVATGAVDATQARPDVPATSDQPVAPAPNQPPASLEPAPAPAGQEAP